MQAHTDRAESPGGLLPPLPTSSQTGRVQFQTAQRTKQIKTGMEEPMGSLAASVVTGIKGHWMLKNKYVIVPAGHWWPKIKVSLPPEIYFHVWYLYELYLLWFFKCSWKYTEVKHVLLNAGEGICFRGQTLSLCHTLCCFHGYTSAAKQRNLLFLILLTQGSDISRSFYFSKVWLDFSVLKVPFCLSLTSLVLA